MKCGKILQNSQKIILGMSGGVDSSVAAYLLLKQGYHVEGVYMKSWDDRDEFGACSADKDYEDVQKVCRQLGINFHEVNFVKPYWNRVFERFIKGFVDGQTPNPDVLCNKEIKFQCFLEYALKERQGHMIATGHYARIQGTHLLRGLDRSKDQSYFLSQISLEALKHSLFPVGHLTKEEVKKCASSLGLVTAHKKESMGICFIGKRSFSKFIKHYVPYSPGVFLDLDRNVLGEHQGLCFYTIGQRAAIPGLTQRWFVVDKDRESNNILVAPGSDHPALYRYELTATQVSWLSEDVPSNSKFKCEAQTRYRTKAEPCTVFILTSLRIAVTFDRPSKAITPGQVIVFYDGERCLGGAIIDSLGPTLYDSHLDKSQNVY